MVARGEAQRNPWNANENNLLSPGGATERRVAFCRPSGAPAIECVARSQGLRSPSTPSTPGYHRSPLRG